MLIKSEKAPHISPYWNTSNIPLFLLKNIEFIVVMFTFICLFALLTIVSGGPMFSDELWYMQVGLNNIKDPLILNRYFHIFLQKFFMEIAPTPLIGVKVFWSFLVSLTGFLVYFNARYFTAQSNFLHGITAVVILYSIDLIASYSGVTIVDITAMTMVMVVVTFYIFSIRFNHTKPLLLAAMGAAFFLSFKTKETTLVLGLLLVGLGFQQDGSFNSGFLLKNLRPFGIGLFVGLVSFILMNTIVLKDPFFGLRPDTFQAFINNYSTTTTTFQSPENWFTDYLFTSLMVPFLLYLISGSRAKGVYPITHRLLWLVPLGFLAFMTFTMIRSNWGVMPRYIFPILGIICLLGSQLFEFHLPEQWRKKFIIAAVIGFELILLYAFRAYIHHLMFDMKWENAFLLETIILTPIALMGLLGIVFIFQKGSIYQTTFSAMLLVVLLIYPLSLNIKSIVLKKPNVQRVEQRFYPFSSFSPQIKFEDDMRFFVSVNIPKNLAMLSDNKDELLSMFNVYFDTGSKRNNFIYSNKTDKMLQVMLTEDYDYVLLTLQEWEDLNETAGHALLVENGYQLHKDQSDLLVLLTSSDMK